jgi:hypothetical protein
MSLVVLQTGQRIEWIHDTNLTLILTFIIPDCHQMQTLELSERLLYALSRSTKFYAANKGEFLSFSAFQYVDSS